VLHIRININQASWQLQDAQQTKQHSMMHEATALKIAGVLK
jgi:hypothetical protein